MTYVLTADEGKWITESRFFPEQDECPNFWKEVRTSTPELFEEVTDDEREQRLTAWDESHQEPEPEPSPESEQPASEQPTDPEQEGGEG